MKILGLDPSSCTGYVVLDIPGHLIESGSADLHKVERFKRLVDLRSWFQSLVLKLGPKLAVVEGYGYANKFSLGTLVEIGTIFRLVLIDSKIPFVEVSPGMLKSFVCNSGNAKKQEMMKEVFKQWDFDTADDNEADAYGLAQFGRALCGAHVGLHALQKKKALDFLKKCKSLDFTQILT